MTKEELFGLYLWFENCLDDHYSGHYSPERVIAAAIGAAGLTQAAVLQDDSATKRDLVPKKPKRVRVRKKKKRARG